jgi:hypothetical protein
MEKAPGVVIVVMRDAMGVGAYRGVRKTEVEEQWELARVERRHGPGRQRNRRKSALQVWPLVIGGFKATAGDPLVSWSHC